MANEIVGSFSKFGTSIQNLIIQFLNDDDFVKLVVSPTDNPLSTIFDITFDKYSLKGTRVYSQIYEPPTDQEVVNVCVYYKKGSRQSNPHYKNVRIGIMIIVHRDLWEISNGLRAYEIAQRVDEIVNREYASLSLSKDFFDTFTYTPVNTLYSAIELVYENWK